MTVRSRCWTKQSSIPAVQRLQLSPRSPAYQSPLGFYPLRLRPWWVFLVEVKLLQQLRKRLWRQLLRLSLRLPLPKSVKHRALLQLLRL